MKAEEDIQISTWSKCILASVTFVVMLFVAEVALYALDYTPRYTGDPEIDNPIPASFWVFDPAYGLRFDAARSNTKGERRRLVNRQGFGDTDDFSYSARLDSTFRILVVGDSFTWGASARRGHSFVDLLEKALSPAATVWNAAIPATATEQAFTTLKTLTPVMKPDLIILGFYMNDFDGNLYPMDSYLRRKDFKAIHLYTLDENAEPQRLSPGAAFERAFNFRPAGEVSPLLYRLRRTRLFSTIETAWERRGPWVEKRTKAILLRTFPPSTSLYKQLDRQRRFHEEVKRRRAAKRKQMWEKSVNMTRTYLRGIRDLAQSQHAALLVVMIPQREDLGATTATYTTAIDLVSDLSIDYVEPLPVLQEQDYAAPPDNHWNDSGHRKAGELLIERVGQIISTHEAPWLQPNP